MNFATGVTINFSFFSFLLFGIESNSPHRSLFSITARFCAGDSDSAAVLSLDALLLRVFA